MIFIIYLIGSVISCFFCWKKWGDIILKKSKNYDPWVETTEFWKIVAITLFYPITFPIYALWQTLELIYNKYNKQK